MTKSPPGKDNTEEVKKVRGQVKDKTETVEGHGEVNEVERCDEVKAQEEVDENGAQSCDKNRTETKTETKSGQDSVKDVPQEKAMEMEVQGKCEEEVRQVHDQINESEPVQISSITGGLSQGNGWSGDDVPQVEIHKTIKLKPLQDTNDVVVLLNEETSEVVKNQEQNGSGKLDYTKDGTEFTKEPIRNKNEGTDDLGNLSTEPIREVNPFHFNPTLLNGLTSESEREDLQENETINMIDTRDRHSDEGLLSNEEYDADDYKYRRELTLGDLNIDMSQLECRDDGHEMRKEETDAKDEAKMALWDMEHSETTNIDYELNETDKDMKQGKKDETERRTEKHHKQHTGNDIGQRQDPKCENQTVSKETYEAARNTISDENGRPTENDITIDMPEHEDHRKSTATSQKTEQKEINEDITKEIQKPGSQNKGKHMKNKNQKSDIQSYSKNTADSKQNTEDKMTKEHLAEKNQNMGDHGKGDPILSDQTSQSQRCIENTANMIQKPGNKEIGGATTDTRQKPNTADEMWKLENEKDSDNSTSITPEMAESTKNPTTTILATKSKFEDARTSGRNDKDDEEQPTTTPTKTETRSNPEDASNGNTNHWEEEELTTPTSTTSKSEVEAESEDEEPNDIESDNLLGVNSELLRHLLPHMSPALLPIVLQPQNNPDKTRDNPKSSTVSTEQLGGGGAVYPCFCWHTLTPAYVCTLQEITHARSSYPQLY